MTLEKCIEVLKEFRWEHEHFLNENDNPFSEDIEAIDTALAAIEELKKAKKLLLVAMIDVVGAVEAADVHPVKWISVKHRLPEIGKSVLIYYPKWNGDEIQVAKLEDDEMMFDVCGEFNMRVGAVTHWMSLPEPPKDGDTNG